MPLPTKKPARYWRDADFDALIDGITEAKAAADLALARIENLPVYADNAAAIAGGLAVGRFYRTATGVVMVVY